MRKAALLNSAAFHAPLPEPKPWQEAAYDPIDELVIVSATGRHRVEGRWTENTFRFDQPVFLEANTPYHFETTFRPPEPGFTMVDPAWIHRIDFEGIERRVLDYLAPEPLLSIHAEPWPYGYLP